MGQFGAENSLFTLSLGPDLGRWSNFSASVSPVPGIVNGWPTQVASTLSKFLCSRHSMCFPRVPVFGIGNGMLDLHTGCASSLHRVMSLDHSFTLRNLRQDVTKLPRLFSNSFCSSRLTSHFCSSDFPKSRIPGRGCQAWLGFYFLYKANGMS